jgi:hypothetical protein
VVIVRHNAGNRARTDNNAADPVDGGKLAARQPLKLSSEIAIRVDIHPAIPSSFAIPHVAPECARNSKPLSINNDGRV